MRFPTMCLCDKQRLRLACAYAQSDQSLCWSLEYSMTINLMTEHHFWFLSCKEAAQAHQSLHLTKCHSVGNPMSRLNYVFITYFLCAQPYNSRCGVLIIYFRHQRISQRAIRMPSRSNLERGSVLEFLRKIIATCDFPGVCTPPPSLDPPMNYCLLLSTLIPLGINKGYAWISKGYFMQTKHLCVLFHI